MVWCCAGGLVYVCVVVLGRCCFPVLWCRWPWLWLDRLPSVGLVGVELVSVSGRRRVGVGALEFERRRLAGGRGGGDVVGKGRGLATWARVGL